MTKPIHIIGGGMAGSEAAWQIAQAGVPVILTEMRGVRGTDAHQTDGLAELVCSNSFRSDDHTANAVGVLHEEMRRLGGIIINTADRHKLPAGSALAVDREAFSADITAQLEAHPLITIKRGVATALPDAKDGLAIIATGPLTGSELADAIQAETGDEGLAFFDAIAPIIYAESVDMTKAWRQSRYDKPGPEGSTDAYINCPMTEAEYNGFIDAILEAPKTEFKEWEGTPYFEGCLPIEVMAERGRETLTFGPMKPVGLTNPHTPEDAKRAYAVVQLRQDNALGTLWNMVGFQTKLKYGAQTDIFRMIPGLEAAQFARLGGIHRNTFINSPKLLDAQLRLKSKPHIRFAGQVTGVEGYVESAAMGLVAGRLAAAEALGKTLTAPPPETAHGALVAHITGGFLLNEKHKFQPMNINFGLFPDPPAGSIPKTDAQTGKRLRGRAKGRAKKGIQAQIALETAVVWGQSETTEARLGGTLLAALLAPFGRLTSRLRRPISKPKA